MTDIGLVYVATPKVASNAIRRLIRERQARILLNPDLTARHYKEYKHEIDKKIKQRATPSKVSAIKKDNYYFSFVRNPLSRLYSCYRDKVLNGASAKKHCTLRPYGIEFGMSFDDFVYQIASIPDDESDQHFRSLHNFLTHQGKSFMNHVGKIETMEQDWRPIHAKFGLDFPQRETSTRVSGPKIAFHDLPYTVETATVAAGRYAQDIAHYDYGNEVYALIEKLKKS